MCAAGAIEKEKEEEMIEGGSRRRCHPRGNLERVDVGAALLERSGQVMTARMVTQFSTAEAGG